MFGLDVNSVITALIFPEVPILAPRLPFKNASLIEISYLAIICSQNVR